MRRMALVLTAMLAAALALPVAADEATDPAVPAAAAEEPSAADAPSRDLVPCGCGGPKAIYAAQYGTVQPPAMREAAEAAKEDAAAGDGETQPASVPSPESDGESAGGGG